jgi:hypothetical protein
MAQSLYWLVDVPDSRLLGFIAGKNRDSSLFHTLAGLVASPLRCAGDTVYMKWTQPLTFVQSLG